MSERDADVVVIGAGVVGLACAAALARTGRRVLVLERHAKIAQETTSRNSEVIHAGIYYPADSLKAALCVAGRELLYARCAKYHIPHKPIGKLIVATQTSEIEVLEDLQKRGTANGVPRLEMISEARVNALEPAVRAVAALHSPVTGIVDGHALSLSYAAEAESHDATILLGHAVIAIEPASRGGYRVDARSLDGELGSLHCEGVVNSAGLSSDAVAALAGFDVDRLGYRLHLCKGDYFSLAPSAPVKLSHLIYPVPAKAGLGVHATLDLGGRIRFGPDTEYVEAIDYGVDAAKAHGFGEAVRRYLPTLSSDWLAPDYAGIRPKLAAPGEGFRDFVIDDGADCGKPGFVNLIGIESPGLTSAGAIAERVRELLA